MEFSCSISFFRSYERCPNNHSPSSTTKSLNAAKVFPALTSTFFLQPTASRHSNAGSSNWYWWLSNKQKMLNGCAQFNILFLNSLKFSIGKEDAFFTRSCLYHPSQKTKNHRHHHTLIHLHRGHQSQGL